MSFIIAVHVKEGIVLASDSRTTYTQTTNDGNKQIVRIGTHITDTTYKTFLCPNGVGISTCGDASILGTPITGYIEEFIGANIDKSTDISNIPQLLIQYFKTTPVIPDTNFIVAGYKKDNGINIQKIYHLNVKTEWVKEIDTDSQGAKWDGETQILSKIIQNTYMRDSNGKEIPLGKTEVSWSLFTLQDAIDFAQYAVDVTIKSMHYSNFVETVGGPIDVLVIKPEESIWIQHKELHA